MPRHRDGHGGWFPSLALALVLVGGCARGPVAPPLTPQQITQGGERFLADQNRRDAALSRWRVDGILEMEPREGTGRRNRVRLDGEAGGRGRLTLFGPMRQTALMIWLEPDRILLLDPQNLQAVEAPANAYGLEALARLPMAPDRLLDVVLGVAAPLLRPLESGEGVALGVTRQGEALTIDPQRGLILLRTGRTGEEQPFRVAYQWPEGDNPMPREVVVTLGPSDDESVLRLELQSWERAGDKPLPPLGQSAVPAGFVLRRVAGGW